MRDKLAGFTQSVKFIHCITQTHTYSYCTLPRKAHGFSCILLPVPGDQSQDGGQGKTSPSQWALPKILLFTFFAHFVFFWSITFRLVWLGIVQSIHPSKLFWLFWTWSDSTNIHEESPPCLSDKLTNVPLWCRVFLPSWLLRIRSVPFWRSFPACLCLPSAYLTSKVRNVKSSPRVHKSSIVYLWF